MKLFSQIRNGGVGNGKRVSDGETRLRHPLTALHTRLLKYPFTIPYPIGNKKETNLRGKLDKLTY